MKQKRLLGILLTITMLMSLLPTFNLTVSAKAADLTVNSVTLTDKDGDGYYDIGTFNELVAFGNAVNGGNNAINGELVANITNTSTDNWKNKAIGTDTYPYQGTFTGNYYRITGLNATDFTAPLVCLEKSVQRVP